MNTTREELQRLSVKRDLRPIAKSLGIRNYSNMRKNLLIDSILESQRSRVTDAPNIMDEPIPEINVPTLIPTKFRKK